MPLTIYEENLIEKIPSMDLRITDIEDYLDNITLDHTHTNLGMLDAIISAGSGSIITGTERAKILEIDNKVETTVFDAHVADPIHHDHTNKATLDTIDSATKTSWDDVVSAFSSHESNTDIHHTHDPADITMLQSFDSGDNAEGNYVRFGNIQICWGIFTRAMPACQAHGVVLGLTDKLFPINFNGTPNMTINVVSSGDFNQYYKFGMRPRADGFEYYIRNSHNAGLPSQDVDVHWMAIGIYS